MSNIKPTWYEVPPVPGYYAYARYGQGNWWEGEMLGVGIVYLDEKYIKHTNSGDGMFYFGPIHVADTKEAMQNYLKMSKTLPNEVKSYIGVKMIDAYPEEREGRPGYVVIYPDGYKSWSPKSVFEKTYFPLHKRNSLNYEDIHAFTSKGVLCISSFESATVATIEYPNGFMDTQSCVAISENNGSDITQCLSDLKTRLWTHLGFIMDWATNGITFHNKDDSKRPN